MTYPWDVSAHPERQISHPVALRVANYHSLSFKYTASGGLLLFARDPTEWYGIREKNWEEYLDCAPLTRESLLYLLGQSP